MSSAFPHRIFDEPDAVDAAVKPKRFKFAPTFLLDLGFSAAMLIALTPVWRHVIAHAPFAAIPSVVMLLAILACYMSKTLTIRHLDGKGGDARTYVKSGALVTTGPYGWSRHPTYALAMLQFLLWAALGVYLQIFAPWSPLLPVQPLRADSVHEFTATARATHVRLNIFPDGGVSRLRVFGKSAI